MTFEFEVFEFPFKLEVPCGPVRPWPADAWELTEDEAFDVIASGDHRWAVEHGRDLMKDMALLRLLEAGRITCAFLPDGHLIAQPTRLAQAQQFN